ncbi:hypothetical protein ACI65C_010526 [Semiaphis heraclei]
MSYYQADVVNAPPSALRKSQRCRATHRRQWSTEAPLDGRDPSTADASLRQEPGGSLYSPATSVAASGSRKNY